MLKQKSLPCLISWCKSLLPEFCWKVFVLQHKDQLFLLGEKKRGRRPRLAVPETSASIPPQPMLALTAPQATPTPVQPHPKAPQAKESILDLSAPKTN